MPRRLRLYGNTLTCLKALPNGSVSHTVCTLLSILGKRFQDVGRRDIESGVIAEGSVSGFLDGRRYNRAVKFHKLMYEVLHSLPWRIFQLRIKRFLEKNLSVHLERIQGHAKVIREVYGCVQAIRL